MDLREVLAVLRSAWWIPLICLCVGAAAGEGASLLTTPLYDSHLQMFVSTGDAGSASEAFSGSQFTQQRVQSYAQLFTSEELANRVATRLNLDTSPTTLQDEVTASVVPGTVLLDVDVSDRSAERARRIADAIGVEFPRFVEELETPEGASSSQVSVTITDRPNLASKPSVPDTKRNIAIGLLVGLVVGIALALLRARMDRSIKNPERAAELSGAPVIGTVIRDETLKTQHVVPWQTGSRVAEDYRQLRTNLQFLNVDDPPKVIMVSSAMPSEGKTTMVINLAFALAEAGKQVTILDADLRRPRVTNYLGMVGGVGLTNILSGTAHAPDVLQSYGEGGVSVIGAGPTPPNPSELLASQQMSTLVDQLRGKSDYLLIDAPPLLPVADATGLGVMVDGVLMSVRYGSSRKDQLAQAVATLNGVGARLLGLVLNIVPPKAGIATAYGYGYSYAEDGRKRRHRAD